jgi:hypothetical protein
MNVEKRERNAERSLVGKIGFGVFLFVAGIGTFFGTSRILQVIGEVIEMDFELRFIIVIISYIGYFALFFLLRLFYRWIEGNK